MFKGDKVWVTVQGKKTPATFDSVQENGKSKVAIEYEDNGKVSTLHMAFNPKMITKRD